MKTYSATISNNSAIVKCSENNSVIYAVRYDNLSGEELEMIDSMTSEDLRNYVNRNEGVVIKVEEEVEESEGDTLPTVYTVNDTESGNYTIYCGTSLEDAKEAILDDEDPEMWDLYIGDSRVWCGKINDVDELNAIK